MILTEMVMMMGMAKQKPLGLALVVHTLNSLCLLGRLSKGWRRVSVFQKTITLYTTCSVCATTATFCYSHALLGIGFLLGDCYSDEEDDHEEDRVIHVDLA